MDRWALRMANFLVGNDGNAAALECTLVGPAVSFDAPTLIAITGGACAPRAGEAPIPAWRAVLVPADTELKLGHLNGVGCRAYLAVAGGIATPPVLGSRSTYMRAALGGHNGRALRIGDELPTGDLTNASHAIADDLARAGSLPCAASWRLAPSLRPRYADAVVARIIGTEQPNVEPCTRALLSQTFAVAAESDRMGFRLQGEPLACGRPPEQFSEAVAFGTVQLPPSGSPIILMADRQTTGGYPRLGTIASVDLPLVGQLAPGNRIRFASISLTEAQRLYLAREQDFAQARTAIMLRYHL